MFKPLYRYDSTRISFTVDFKIYDGNNNVVYSDITKWGAWQPSLPASTPKSYYYLLQVIISSIHKIGKCGDEFIFTSYMPANFDHT